MRAKSRIFYWYAAFVVALICLTILPEPDKTTMTRYHIGASELRVLTATLILPEIAIWFTAFFGYYKLHHYSQLIATSKEGKHIAKLARGLGLLAFGLPATSIFTGVLSLVAAHYPDFKTASIIINNYASIVFPLAAFVWLSMGARGLSDVSRIRPSWLMTSLVAFVTLGLGIAFCCLIVLYHKELRTTYHMSPELVMLTLAIPYMYMWALGLAAVAELRAYSRKLQGIVYRKSWRVFIIGIASIIVLSIILQYLSTLTSWLASLSLSWILLLLYVLLLLLTGAFIVVALGAQRLTKIEEA